MPNLPSWPYQSQFSLSQSLPVSCPVPIPSADWTGGTWPAWLFPTFPVFLQGLLPSTCTFSPSNSSGRTILQSEKSLSRACPHSSSYHLALLLSRFWPSP